MRHHRCSLPLCDEIIYNVWSQAASSACAPANDFLRQPPFLATMAMDFLFSAAGYTVRVGGDGETARVEGKFLQSEGSESCPLLKNTTCLGAELLFPSEGNADEKNDICDVMNVSGAGVAVFEVWLHLE